MRDPNRREVMLGALGALVIGPTLFARLLRAEDAEEFTADNIEGPFYKPDAPWRSRLRVGDEGEALLVTGVVLGPGKKPLAGAVVDVWHADAKGDYDNDDFAHRGRVKTDAEGRYSIETLLPGRYAIDQGDRREHRGAQGKKFRPSHIHYKVSADGHRTLTTQLYFKDDPHLEKDPFVKKSLVKEVAKKDGKASVQFDVKLRAAAKK